LQINYLPYYDAGQNCNNIVVMIFKEVEKESCRLKILVMAQATCERELLLEEFGNGVDSLWASKVRGVY